MTERGPDDLEFHEIDADDLAHEVVEPDPEDLPGPIPDDERELRVDDESDLENLEGDLEP